MNNINDIIKTRSFIKNKILNNEKLSGYEKERKQIFDLINRTVYAGESNSALLIGPRGIGKTKLINDVLNEIKREKNFSSSALLVRLHGLIHTDDRLALKSVTSQMNLDNVVDGKVFGSFAENLSFLLACLQTGQKEIAKSIIFILEEFDLFCAHHNQTLLYNLFDVSQSAQTPVCVLGVTCRLDVIELFEKRVKSRFSHRQIFLFAESNESGEISDVDEKITRILNLLILPTKTKEFSSSFVMEWNKRIKSLMNEKRINSLIERLHDIDPSEKILQNIILIIVSRLNEEKLSIDIRDFEEQLEIFEQDELIKTMQDLSVLELCLIIAMKHHIEIYDNQAFNFEMILTRYNQFVSKNSNVQGVPRAVILKAFEHLQNIEFISPISSTSGRLQKEYRTFKLLVTSEQILEAVKKFHGLPTEISRWANSSLA